GGEDPAVEYRVAATAEKGVVIRVESDQVSSSSDDKSIIRDAKGLRTAGKHLLEEQSSGGTAIALCQYIPRSQRQSLRVLKRSQLLRSVDQDVRIRSDGKGP